MDEMKNSIVFLLFASTSSSLSFVLGDVLFRIDDVISLQGISLLKYLKQDCLQMSSFVP